MISFVFFAKLADWRWGGLPALDLLFSESGPCHPDCKQPLRRCMWIQDDLQVAPGSRPYPHDMSNANWESQTVRLQIVHLVWFHDYPDLLDSLYVHFWRYSVVPISSVAIVLSFCRKLLKLKTKWQHDPPDPKELRPLLVRYVFRDCELQSASRSHDEGPQKQEMMEGTSAVRAFCWLIYRLGMVSGFSGTPNNGSHKGVPLLGVPENTLDMGPNHSK